MVWGMPELTVSIDQALQFCSGNLYSDVENWVSYLESGKQLVEVGSYYTWSYENLVRGKDLCRSVLSVLSSDVSPQDFQQFTAFKIDPSLTALNVFDFLITTSSVLPVFFVVPVEFGCGRGAQ